METGLWVTVGVLIVVIIMVFLAVIAALLIKIYVMKKSAREIEAAFADRLITDTNVLIDISSRDRDLRHLANSMNVQLRRFRAERRRFQQGDLELKDAVTNISHDLRTPLTAICGYLELLEQEEKSEAVDRYIGIIKERTEVLTQLSEELFRYSVITSTKDRMNKEMPGKKVVRMLDCSALSRVFSNLISNVVKYGGGDLKVVLSEDGEIVFSNRASGLDEVQAGRLFDRFYTVEAARRSTGLGLAISKTLVEEMDGRITAKYEGGRLSICISFSDVDR